jgi:hypothetical protein
MLMSTTARLRLLGCYAGILLVTLATVLTTTAARAAEHASEAYVRAVAVNADGMPTGSLLDSRDAGKTLTLRPASQPVVFSGVATPNSTITVVCYRKAGENPLEYLKLTFSTEPTGVFGPKTYDMAPYLERDQYVGSGAWYDPSGYSVYFSPL